MHDMLLPFAFIVALLVVLPMAGRQIWDTLKVLYSPNYDENSGMRGGYAIGVGLVVTLGKLILDVVNGRIKGGFFGAIEDGLFYWLIFSSICYVIFRVHHIYYWLRSTPIIGIVIAGLLLPVAAGVSYLVGRFLGFPAFSALMKAWDEWLVSSAASSYSEYYDMCMKMAVGSSVYSWAFFAKNAWRLRSWPLALIATAIIAFISCFLGLGIAGALLVGFVGWIIVPIFAKVGEKYEQIYDATPDYLHHQDRDEITRQVMKSPFVWLMGKKEDDE